MPKRRRERDRPKAGPDSAYNPHKRILLSYDSDDEGEELERVQEHAPNGDAKVSGPNSVVPTAVPQTGCEEKHPLVDEEEEDVELESEEPGEGANNDEEERPRQRPRNERPLWSKIVRPNLATGQKAALGSLSYQWEDGDGGEEVDSEEEEAMAYLRAVRSERQSMPEVFAKARSHPDDDFYNVGMGDTRGFLEDGAYVALPNLGPAIPDSARTMSDPRDVYTKALIKRFLAQRHSLHIDPTEDAIGSLDARYATSFSRKNNKAWAEWYRTINTMPPHPDQVRLMNPETVDGLLELLQKHFVVREKILNPTTSAWIWALLAKLEEVGTMGNSEVSVLREFAKKALLVQFSFEDAATAAQIDDAHDAEHRPKVSYNWALDHGRSSPEPLHDDKTADDGSDANGTFELPETGAVDTDARQNTLATLDAIVVIIGEVFGQRDLLDARREWTAPEHATN